MPPAELFLSVYYNGHVGRTDTEGVVFACNHTTLLKVKTNMKLHQLIQKIQKKIQPDNTRRVVGLIYRYPTALAQGYHRYESLNLVGDDDVQMMFDMFRACKRLGVSAAEVYAELVDAPNDDTQTEPPYSEPIDLSSPTQEFSPLFTETQPHHHHSMQNSSTYRPTPSTQGVDLNTTIDLNIPVDPIPISVVAGVHNEEVGDFSDNEDDLLGLYAAAGDEDMESGGGPSSALQFYDLPSHFRNVTSDEVDNSDPEFGHPMSRTPTYLVPNSDNLQVGMTFPTKEMAQHAIREYHLNKSQNFIVEYSDQDRWIVCCENQNCMWRCRVAYRKKLQLWEIRKLEAPYTCASTQLSQDHRQLSSDFICESILQLVKEDPTISVSVLIAHIRSKYTYTTTYRKAWMAKQNAVEKIFGNWEESYKELPQFMLALQSYVPGTIVDWQTMPFYEHGQLVHGKGTFHRLFWTFQQCINAFPYCKPVVSVDGTWLYGKYRGTLLMAIAQDGRNQPIPIAYALVEGETADAWYFFLQRLRMFVTPQPDLCLISDRHESIKSAVRRLNSDWHHVFCIRHIAQNFMRTFKNADMRKSVINMGYSMTQPGTAYYKSEISEWSEEVVRWVDNIPKEQWLQAWDEGRRWGHVTTNLAECINNVLKGTRNLPITSLVRSTYHRLNAKFVERGRQAQAMMTSGMIYTDIVIEKLEIERGMSNSHQVQIFNREQSIFTVKELRRPPSGRPTGTFKVDLGKQWCDCGEFQALHYPCSHVIAACSHVHHDYMTYVPPQYTLQYVFNVYREEFQPVPHESYWPKYNGVELCHNPAMRRDPKGRPQSTRIRTEMDQREKSRHPKRCGLCRNEGHSKNKCPNRSRTPDQE